uniref:Programmed cell death 11 n=1 Tax=Astyanax mexicanus TaxID=7994 RepID=W5KDC8_ASTMX
MASMEEDFPRGGSGKTAPEAKTAKTRVEVDNLFENLKIGTAMLGCVKEISDFEIVVGLPSGLRGFLPISSICDSYNELLTKNLDSGNDLETVSSSELLVPGQLVRCVVSSLGTSKQGFACIKVSINPKEVNKDLSSSSLKAGMTLGACVESIEDHGYLIDIGVAGTKAFLPKLNVGRYMTVLVTEVKNGGRVVRVSVNPEKVSQACAGPQHGWTLSNLLPGLLVQARIKKVTLHGLIVTFLSSYTGVVDFMHIDPDKASKYSVGDEVKARVVYTEPSTRHVSLSLRSHLLPPEGDVLNAASIVQVGTVIDGCKMTAVHYHSGAIMELPDGNVAFVHKYQMKESSEEYNPNRLLAEPKHNLRITDYSPLEQIHIATLRIIKTTYFSHQDIKVGQLIECTVLSVEKYGVHVKISDHIKAMVPKVHLADVTLTNPEKKFKVDMRIQCRVLSVDVANRKIILTRKKSLIESPLPVLALYSDARVGLITHGVIVCIKDFGCIVRFYGDVKGLVPKTEMTTDSSANPQSLFYVGQVVKAKVLRCDVELEKLVLSFRAVTQADVEAVNSAKFDFEVGKVEAVVLKKDLTGLHVSILPDEVPALLPMIQLSDHSTNWPLLWDGLQEGDLISNVVCLSKNKQGITLSKKPMLLAALSKGDVVKSFSELQVGMIMVGWVKDIMPYGVFVHFPHNLFGLAPSAAISDKFIPGTEGLFQVGQTVLAKVTNLDEEKHRFLVSLKESEVIFSKEEAQARLFQGQSERRAAYEMKTNRDALLEELSTVTLGDKLKLTVGDTTEDGSVNLTSDQFKNVTVQASAHHAEVNATPGCKVTVVVLHVDLLASQIHVSLLPELTVKKKLEKGSQHTATVQYVDKDFAVISLGDTGHLTVISSTSHLNEVFRFESEKLSVGSTLPVTVTKLKCKDLGERVLVTVTGKPGPTTRQRTTSESLTPKHSYNIGDVVTAKIRTIKPTHVLVDLKDGVSGSIHVSEIQESPEVGSFPTSSLRVGTEVKARVIGGREVHAHKLQDYKPGDEIKCFVSKTHKLEVGAVIMGSVQKINPQRGLALKLPFGKFGFAFPTDLSDTYTENPLENYKEGQVVLSRSITGRALFRHATSYFVDDNTKFEEYIPRNTLVTAKILIDVESCCVGLSLLPEDTGAPDVLPESLGLRLRQKQTQKEEEYCKFLEKRKRKISESQEEAREKKKPKEEKKSQAEDRDSGVDVYFREEETAKQKKKPAKRSRQEMEQERKQAEQNLSRLEAEQMDPSARPESSGAFERLLLSSPDSSLLWLQYMAFHLQATQIEQARAVAERAIKTISFEEQEKLNVWVALLNLENMYGTEESLQKVFERAVQYCEPMPVYQQLADIYAKSNKMKEAESLYKNMVKRFKQEKAVWQSYGSFLLQQGQSDAANALLQRALQSLSNKDVDLITKFARLEFQYGSKDRGKAMLDKVLSSYPKRTDLWSVFIDLMVKHGSQKEVDLFDRVIHLSASVKKIKFFFKRYLDYEKQHGTPESIQAVKQKALEYVEAKGT